MLRRVAGVGAALLLFSAAPGAPGPGASALGMTASGAPAVGRRAAQQAPSPDLESLHFVGRGDRSALRAGLDEADLRLLLGFRDGATLDQLLARGIPFSSERLGRLIGLGLLGQQDRAFRTRIPVLVGDETARFREAVRGLVPEIVGDVLPSFRALEELLGRRGLSHAFPVLATWAIRERGWHHRLRQIDLPRLVASQRQADPGRGWWGVGWYVDPALEPLHRLDVARNRDRTLQLCSVPGALFPDPTPLSSPGLGPEAPLNTRLGQLLAVLDDDLTVDHADRFPTFRRLGLIDATDRLRAPLLPWSPDQRDSVAAAVEEAASAVADAVGRRASLAEVGLEGLDEPAVHSLVYHELAPELLRGLDAVGLAALVGTGPVPGESVGTGTAGTEDPTTTDGSADPGRPVLSAVLWDGLPPREPAFPLSW